MNALSALVLNVIISLKNPEHADAERERLRPVAEAIAGEAQAGATFAGEDGPRKTAVWLVTAAHHESGFLESVRTCRRKGDAGRAISLYQMQRWATRGYTAEQVCSSDALQAYLAARAVRRSGARTPRAMFAAYAGKAGVASEAMTAQYQRLEAKTRPAP